MFDMQKYSTAHAKAVECFFVISEELTAQIPQPVQILCRKSPKSTGKLARITLGTRRKKIMHRFAHEVVDEILDTAEKIPQTNEIAVKKFPQCHGHPKKTPLSGQRCFFTT